MKRLIFALSLIILMSFPVLAQDEPEAVALPPAPPKVGESLFYGKISAEQEKSYLKKLDDETRKNLEAIKKYDEKKYTELLFQSKFQSFGYAMPEMKKMDNDRSKSIWNLELESELLALKIKKDDGNRLDNEKQLKTKLSKLFDLRELDRQEEVKLLEKELSELKEALQFRLKNKSEIVERRLKELTGESKYLDWN